METTSPHTLSLGTIGAQEHRRFLDFVDAAFGRPAGRSLRHDFPTALGANNLPHLFVGRIEDEIVCAAAALVRTWRTSAGALRTACLGCFSTPAALRGRGYSAALQQHMLAELHGQGVHWAVLWTDVPEVYQGRGFVTAGEELHGRLTDVTWSPPAEGCQVREARASDAASLLALYEQHELRADRSVSDLRDHLDPRTSRVLVLETAGRARAYAAIGKGADFAGYVHEYAGPVDLVHALWGEAVRKGAEFVLVPDGAQRYLGAAASGMPCRPQSAAMVRILAPDVAGDDGAAIRWAAWGFDSA